MHLTKRFFFMNALAMLLSELFERVWGMEALSDAATVTVHIARIREKFEENPSKPQTIGTVRGSGYRFIV